MIIYRKVFFLLLTICLTIPSLAKKKEKRLEKLFVKGKYEKCLKKCNRIIRSELSPLPYYYISFINFHNFKIIETDSVGSNNSLLKSSLSSLSFAIKIDSNGIYKEKYVERLLEIKDTLFAINNRLLILKQFQQSEYYARNILTLFSDSTAVVARIEAIKDTVQITEVVIDSISEEEKSRRHLISLADSLIRIPYCYGGDSPETGFDCSGFVQFIYENIGFELPRTTTWQSLAGVEIEEEQALPGDLIFFTDGSKTKGISHVGLVRSKDHGILEIIHSVSGGVSKTMRGSYDFEYWYNRIIKIKNVVSGYFPGL